MLLDGKPFGHGEVSRNYFVSFRTFGLTRTAAGHCLPSSLWVSSMSFAFLRKSLGLLFVSVVLLAQTHAIEVDRPKLNLLIVTVDDMSADSLGAYGCLLADTSPSIDAFARQSLRFMQAHVQVGNCMPGRNIMWSGLYAHKNGVEGFIQNPEADYPVLCDLAKEAGYFTAIRGKVSHSTPYHPYAWDAVLDESEQGKRYHIKDPASYGESTRRGIELADQAGKPFCLMINISDPHKPFYSERRQGETGRDPFVPTRVFTAEEVPVPGFLFEDPLVRQELALYYSSVRRADDAFREVMRALDQSGQAENTFVMFLSDHGMPLPFAKTQLYHHSTHTPLMIRWPGVTRAGAKDDQHMVSAVDLLPTLLDVIGHQHPTPERLQGRSFEPLLRGETQQDRDFVILQYNQNAGGSRHPMRGIQTKDFLYLYNPWSDGNRKFATATTGTVSYRQMVKRASSDAAIAARLQLFDHRVLEEFYHVSRDPDCLENLMGYTEHRTTIKRLRNKLADSLGKLDDPVAPLLADVQDAAKRHDFMAKEDQRVLELKQRRRQRNSSSRRNQTQSTNAKAALKDAIRLECPTSVKKGASCQIVIHHEIPESLNVQMLHVTLKTASLGPKAQVNGRIHREVLEVRGKGTLEVDFRVPEAISEEAVRVAAFLGEDYQSNLQYLQSPAIPVAK
jgi:N-sulfoglucosamine sulfohydrolase